MVIYSLNDLMNKIIDDEEIEIVLKSLQYSLILGMFNYMKIKLSQDEIIKLVKTDDWFNQYQWTQIQRDKFRLKLEKIFYNLYRFGPKKCENSANDWLFIYGFKVKPSRKYYHKK